MADRPRSGGGGTGWGVRAAAAAVLTVLASLLPGAIGAAGDAERWSDEVAPPVGRGLERQSATRADRSASPASASSVSSGAPDGSPGRARADGPATADAACDPGPPGAANRFDPFYKQVCWTDGIPVVASGEVDVRALVAAAGIVDGVLATRPDLAAVAAERGMSVAVLGRWQRAVDLPEYRDLPERYPEENWEAARAYSATGDRPLLAAPEENLACQSADTYPGQQVLVHELGHSVLDLAVRPTDRTFWPRVVDAYDEALIDGRWVGYYGATSPAEYWADGVQAYFDAAAASAGPDPFGTPAADRAALARYDPALFELVREVFGDNSWRAPRCP